MNLPIKLIKNVESQESGGNWGDPTETKYSLFAEIVPPSSAFRSYDAQTQLGQVKTFRLRFSFELHPTGDWKIEFRKHKWTVKDIREDQDRLFYWLVTASYQ